MRIDGPEGSLDTIISEATSPGRGGVALLRLSGPRAHAVALELFSPLGRARPAPRRCVLGHVRLPDGTADEALCTLFVAPASFTGEDAAELGIHGNPWVVAAQLEAARAAGARLARPGEFSYRAWLNGRVDLTQAEALDSLIQASSPAAAAEAARQAAGGLGDHLTGLRDVIVAALVELEAAVDFHDDSVGQRRIDEALAEARTVAARQLGGAQRTRALQEGLRVVLSGPPNAGKSSLFNALLAAERAIVTDEPGTTRDLLEEQLVLDGRPLVLVDAAGDREALSAAEVEGVRRARAARDAADLVLEVRDATSSPADWPSPAGSVRLVLSKTDLLGEQCLSVLPSGQGIHRVSARDGQGLSALLDDLQGECRRACSGEGVLLLAARQRALAEEVLEHLEQALEDRRNGQSEEYVAESLREALQDLAELLGGHDPESIYEAIFSRFCVGK